MKLFRHLVTITRHRHAVIRHGFRAGIGGQVLFHDLSKYTPTELIPGARYYQGRRSPNEREREVQGYSSAWLHHKGRNRHHFEYWTDYQPAVRRVMPVKMPYRYVVEMLCDRLAASKIYQGDAYTDRSGIEYFLRGKQNRFIHPETSDEIEHLLTVVAEQGEEAAFAETRRRLREERREKRRKTRRGTGDG